MRRPEHLRLARYAGLFHDDLDPDSAWIRERGTVRVPELKDPASLTIHGRFLPSPSADLTTAGAVGLRARVNGRTVVFQRRLRPGAFAFTVPPSRGDGNGGFALELALTGVGIGNFLAWLGRITEKWMLPRRLRSLLDEFRGQKRNRQVRIDRIEIGSDLLYDFSNRHAAYNPAFGRKHFQMGLNVVGFFRADLGIGESARCMARAAEAAALPAAFIDLKLHCKASQSDTSFRERMAQENRHHVNVFHLDAPQARDIDHHHGRDFRRKKYNIAYWAWELPEFPDAWVPYCEFFDEIWAPSDFVREAVGMKVPLPVLTMPHAIQFRLPAGDARARFNLPADKFLFLFVYDLNSYQARKNPEAVIEAFRLAFGARSDAALVIKTQSLRDNEADFARLKARVDDLPGTILLAETLSRPELYALQAACDCFVSLHRSEGFGLAVAECMFLGKPVIATNWSGTAEYLDRTNGCPVDFRLVTLDRNHGPYAKGQTWAEPDAEHAAWWMRKVCEDAGFRKAIGQAARATVRTRFSPEAIGRRYRRRLEALAGW